MPETISSDGFLYTPDPAITLANTLEIERMVPQLAQSVSSPQAFMEADNTSGSEWRILGFQDVFLDAHTPAWVIEGLVMAETVTLVSAHPHAMKSLSWLYATLEAVVTKKVFGHFAAPEVNNSFFIETEDPEWLVKQRLQGFARGLGLTEGNQVPGFRFTCPGPFGLSDQVDNLATLINQHSLDLIVLSTLQNTLEGRDWKEQKQMADVMANLVQTARLCPIVVLTHSPQNQRLKRAAGAITIGANCATHIHYEKSVDRKAGETYVNLTVDSKAGATETQFALRLLRDPNDPDPVGSVRGVVYDAQGRKYQRSHKEAILEVLQENPDATTDEIVRITGAGKRNVQNVRKKFLDE